MLFSFISLDYASYDILDNCYNNQIKSINIVWFKERTYNYYLVGRTIHEMQRTKKAARVRDSQRETSKERSYKGLTRINELYQITQLTIK